MLGYRLLDGLKPFNVKYIFHKSWLKSGMGLYSYIICKNPILMQTLRACYETRESSTLYNTYARTRFS